MTNLLEVAVAENAESFAKLLEGVRAWLLANPKQRFFYSLSIRIPTKEEGGT